MLFSKCDLCKKEVEKFVCAGTEILRSWQFCYDCGNSVVDFLKKHKFIKEEEKYGRTKEKK